MLSSFLHEHWLNACYVLSTRNAWTLALHLSRNRGLKGNDVKLSTVLISLPCILLSWRWIEGSLGNADIKIKCSTWQQRTNNHSMRMYRFDLLSPRGTHPGSRNSLLIYNVLHLVGSLGGKLVGLVVFYIASVSVNNG